MSDINVWFRKEIGVWRTVGAVTWSVLLLPPVTVLLLLAANFQIFHPFSWIYGSLIGVLHPSSWLYLFILSVITVAIATVNGKHFTVEPTVYSRRLDYIQCVLRPSRLVHGVGHAAAAASLVWSLTGLLGGQYAALSRPCGEDGASWCLNEQHTFLVLHGAAVGWLYSAAFFIYNNNYLTFPIVQQSKFFRVKSSLLSLFLSSAGSVAGNMRYFCLFYYIIGGYLFKHWVIGNVLNISDTGAVDTLWGMLNLRLLWQTFVTGSAVHFVFSLTCLLHSVYHTEAVEFVIESDFEQDRGHCLQHAVTSNNSLVQYLGYQDLYLLSKHCPARRQQIFSLSQLGGHPHQWINISKHALKVMNDFSESVLEYNVATLGSTGPGGRKPSGEVKPINNNAAPASPVKSTGASGFMPASPTAGENTSAPKPKPASSRRALLPFLTSDLPDVGSRKVFASAQKTTWAVQAVSYLVTASYQEDTYGVVQKSLPDIISALLHLHEVVEKHVKIVGARPRGNADSSDTALRLALRGATKSAIYRIVHTFQSHLKSIPLGVEQARKLAQFSEYKE